MAERGGSKVRMWSVPLVVFAIAVALIVVIVQNMRNESSTDASPSSGAASGAGTSSNSATGPNAGTASSSPGTSTSTASPPQQQGLSYVERRDPDDLLGFGDVNAPIGLVVYSDYQCGYCATWSTDTLPQVMPYVEAGDLRLEWRDVNVFGEDSERAARASYAAAIQDEYWAYHDALYAGGAPSSDLSEESLIALAVEVGLDQQQFVADLNADDTVEQVAQNMQEGLSLGVTGTPTFILGGEPIVGNQSTDVFITAIDQMLAAQD
ncbi:DsbA family protein [Cumulibacter soli]|uniref:DsbA family protein n=1 Tax=Cumulibacter soli TaxID=2546344 RepID=UPI001ABB75E2|nr:thioredoxin domain-containing protein [Cumulibacter soli]